MAHHQFDLARIGMSGDGARLVRAGAEAVHAGVDVQRARPARRVARPGAPFFGRADDRARVRGQKRLRHGVVLQQSVERVDARVGAAERGAGAAGFAGVRDEEGSAPRLGERAHGLFEACAVSVGLDDGGALRGRGDGRQLAPVGDERGEVDRQDSLRFRACRRFSAVRAHICSGNASSRARLEKRVTSASNCSSTVPVGPWRCLPMMTSALPWARSISASQLSELLRAFARLLVLEVIFLAIHEHHHVGVLFDRARFTQVRELRALVVARFNLTRQLGQRDDRGVQLLGQRLEAGGDLGQLLHAVARRAISSR